jgi:hypothetical protein
MRHSLLASGMRGANQRTATARWSPEREAIRHRATVPLRGAAIRLSLRDAGSRPGPVTRPVESDAPKLTFGVLSTGRPVGTSRATRPSLNAWFTAATLHYSDLAQPIQPTLVGVVSYPTRQSAQTQARAAACIGNDLTDLRRRLEPMSAEHRQNVCHHIRIA